MSMNGRELKNELETLLDQIELQIEEVRRQADELECKPEQVQNPDGSYMMLPLLISKTQVLATLSNLRPNIVNHMTPPPSPHRLH